MKVSDILIRIQMEDLRKSKDIMFVKTCQGNFLKEKYEQTKTGRKQYI